MFIVLFDERSYTRRAGDAMRSFMSEAECAIQLCGWSICVQWALGVALWELMTSGLEPYADVAPQNLASYLRRGFRLSQPVGCSTPLYVLCTNSKTSQSVTMCDQHPYHCVAADTVRPSTSIIHGRMREECFCCDSRNILLMRPRHVE